MEEKHCEKKKVGIYVHFVAADHFLLEICIRNVNFYLFDSTVPPAVSQSMVCFCSGNYRKGCQKSLA